MVRAVGDASPGRRHERRERRAVSMRKVSFFDLPEG
jgi:hypothetical protein